MEIKQSNNIHGVKIKKVGYERNERRKIDDERKNRSKERHCKYWTRVPKKMRQAGARWLWKIYITKNKARLQYIITRTSRNYISPK